MASEEQAKPPEASVAAATAASAPPPAAAAVSAAEWAASVQAYYAGNAAAAAAAAGYPYVWPSQHMMPPYGTPIPFSPMYHPGAYYAHPSMGASVVYPAGEAAAAVASPAGGKSKGTTPEKSADGRGAKGNSAGPSCDDASRSGYSGSEGSSETRDDDADQKDSSAAKKRKSGGAFADGEPSQVAIGAQYTMAESPYAVKGRSATKLPVSAPGRAALPSATPNLNIGMDLWSSSQTVAPGHAEANAGLVVARRDGIISQQHLDERELKRERRKQSNRESARRSRLRKQQECEELARRVADLTTENGALKSEVDQLKKACEEMEAENSRLMDEMVQSQGPGILSTLGIHNGDSSKVHAAHGNNSHYHNHANNGNGSFNSGSHNPESDSR